MYLRLDMQRIHLFMCVCILLCNVCAILDALSLLASFVVSADAAANERTRPMKTRRLISLILCTRFLT